MSRAVKLVVDKLIRDMRERPEDFRIDEHTLKDGATNYEYWIANGFPSAGIYAPYRMGFGFIQGLRFHSALNNLKAWKNLNAEAA